MDQDTKDQYRKALDYGYFYLKFRPRTKKEMERYLIKKSEKFLWHASIIESVISELEEQKLLNDYDFTVWFVEQRNAAKPKSEFALRAELLRYGVPKDTIADYFNRHNPDEEALAEQALSPRWGRFASLDRRIRFQKAASFLVRRGFSFDMIKKTIAKYEEKK